MPDRHRHGKPIVDFAKELARRSLEVVCARKGLKFCDDRSVFYFPRGKDGNEWNQKITHVDGRSTTVQLTGERTKGWGVHASLFLYQLAPLFLPRRDSDGSWHVVVRVYVRVTMPDECVFKGKEIGRYRKIVTRSWWNKEWLARLLGVVQALQTADGCIEIGEGRRAVIMRTQPLSWMCPVGLDVQALSSLPDVGEEIAQFRARDAEDDEEEALIAADEGVLS
jgi:hypothetical protein